MRVCLGGFHGSKNIHIMNISFCLSVSLFVQSLRMRRWISSTVWTTVAPQPPTPTILPHKAPPAPPTHPPMHTRTHTLTHINTLLPWQPPARTRSLQHIGPTGRHTPASCLVPLSLPPTHHYLLFFDATLPLISLIYHHLLNLSICPLLHLSFIFFSLSLLARSRSVRLIRMLQTSFQDSLSFPLSSKVSSTGFSTI